MPKVWLMTGGSGGPVAAQLIGLEKRELDRKWKESSLVSDYPAG